DAERSVGDPAPLVARCIVSAAQTREVAFQIYRQIAFEQRIAFGALFDAVLAGGPVLFHCAAGKDRTGVAAALLLTVLGADRDVVRADYAASAAALPEIEALFVKRTLGNAL